MGSGGGTYHGASTPIAGFGWFRAYLAWTPSDRAFTAGLLSVLPGLVDRPIDKLVAEMPVDDRLASAIIDHLGAEGRLLAAMIAYEDGQRATADGFPRLLAAITRIYAESSPNRDLSDE